MELNQAGGGNVPGICNRYGHSQWQSSGRGKYDYTEMKKEETLSIQQQNLHTDCKEVLFELHNTQSDSNTCQNISSPVGSCKLYKNLSVELKMK